MTYPSDLDTITVTHKITDAGGRALAGNTVTAVPSERVWTVDGSIVEYRASTQIATDGTWELDLPYVDQERIRNKGVPWRITEHVPGNPKSYLIAPTLAHGAGPIDAAEALVSAPSSRQTVIQAGPVTDEAAAQLLDRDGEFATRLKGTIGRAARGDNLIVDGSFEDGYRDWQMLSGVSVVETSQARTGSHAIFVPGGPSLNTVVYQDYVPASEGSCFYAEYWINRQTPTASGTVRLSFQFEHADGSTSLDVPQIIDADTLPVGQWQRVAATSIPAPAGVVGARFYPYMSGGTGAEYLIDDIRMIDVTYTENALAGTVQSSDVGRIITSPNYEHPITPGDLLVVTPSPTWFTDFSGDAVGQPPAGWTGQWTPGAWEVVPSLDGTGGRTLRLTSTATGAYGLAWDALGEQSDAEVLMRWRSPDAGTSPRAALRGAGAAGAEDGALLMWNSSTSVQVGIYDNGGFSYAHRAPSGYPLTSGVWQYSRFRTYQGTMLGKVWRDGEGEPTAWSVGPVNRDSTLPAAGWAGIVMLRGNAALDIDWISAATGGGRAPMAVR